MLSHLSKFLGVTSATKQARSADENVGGSDGAGASFRLTAPESDNSPNRPRSLDNVPNCFKLDRSSDWCREL